MYTDSAKMNKTEKKKTEKKTRNRIIPIRARNPKTDKTDKTIVLKIKDKHKIKDRMSVNRHQ
jgi:hypothetical protein